MHQDKDQAYLSGAYTMAEIERHFEVHCVMINLAERKFAEDRKKYGDVRIVSRSCGFIVVLLSEKLGCTIILPQIKTKHCKTGAFSGVFGCLLYVMHCN